MKKDILNMLNDVRADQTQVSEKVTPEQKKRIIEMIEKEENIMNKNSKNNVSVLKRCLIGLSTASIAAAAFLFIAGSFTENQPSDSIKTADLNSSYTLGTQSSNFFFLSASAEENADRSRESDRVILKDDGDGTTFTIKGSNISAVELSIDKGSLCRGNYKMEEAYGTEPIGNHFVDKNYNENRFYGLYVSDEMYAKHDAEVPDSDIKKTWHKCIDDFDGANLDITVTYKDGSSSTSHYSMQTGRIGVYIDPETNTQKSNGKFVKETDPHFYGVVISKKS